MGTQENDAAEANETSYPPSYEETQYEPSNSDTAPLLDRKLAHLDAAISGAQPRHVSIDVGGPQASTSTGNSSNNAVNYLYIDSRSDVVGDYVIDTNLAPIPGRFKSLKDKDAAENVYISLSHGALLNVKLYISGTTPAKVTVAVPRSHSAVLPHCLELVSFGLGSLHLGQLCLTGCTFALCINRFQCPKERPTLRSFDLSSTESSAKQNRTPRMKTALPQNARILFYYCLHRKVILQLSPGLSRLRRLSKVVCDALCETTIDQLTLSTYSENCHRHLRSQLLR